MKSLARQQTRNTVLTVLLVTFFAFMCTTLAVNRMYSGAPLPEEKIAILYSLPRHTMARLNTNTPIKIIAIDDWTEDKIKKNWYDGSTRVELLPGHHRIKVILEEVSVQSSRSPYVPGTTTVTRGIIPQTIGFEFLPGKIYQIEAEIDDENKTWQPTIKDITEEAESWPEINDDYFPR